jgi:NitT/TauT family transport system substrate-binding protein
MVWRLLQSLVWLLALSVVALLLLALGGCERRAAAGAGEAATEVRLGYFANVTHAQAVLGTASGDFAAAVAPARFSARVFNAGPSLIEALFAGQIDVGYVGPGPVLNAHQKTQGQAIRIVSGAAANGVLIVARKGSGITSMSDLAGRRIATPQFGNTQDVSARHYVLSVLKQPDTNTIIPIANAEQAGMMDRGQIDAAWAPEPWASRLIAEAGATLIAPEKDLWPGGRFALTVVVTTPEFLARHPDLLKKVLAVHATWTHRLASDPQAYAAQLDDALAALSGKRLKAGVIAASLKNVQFTLDPLPGTLETMGRWASDLGLARAAPDLAGLIDPSLLPSPAGAAPPTGSPVAATATATTTTRAGK